MSETSKTIPTEPISPELALIDPELASSARARPAATRAETPPADLESAAGGTPRFHLRPLPASSAWLTLCVVLLVGGLFVLPTGRWLDAADIHIRYLRTSWPAVLSGADHGSRLKSADGSETAKKAEVRLAALQPHAFGWVRVPKATYYRVRFYRDGRQIFVAHPTKPRIILPARWRFDGRTFRLDPGHYRWIVQPGFGTPSARRNGTTIVIADWLAAKP